MPTGETIGLALVMGYAFPWGRRAIWRALLEGSLGYELDGADGFSIGWLVGEGEAEAGGHVCWDELPDEAFEAFATFTEKRLGGWGSSEWPPIPTGRARGGAAAGMQGALL